MPFFKSWKDANRIGIDDISGYVLDSRPSSEFLYDAARNKLINLELRGSEMPSMAFTTPGDDLLLDPQARHATGQQGKLMRLARWIDLDSKLTVCQA